MKSVSVANVSRGFTLVEILVVIAIIALLLAALLPAFSSVKKSAKVAQTKSYFTALDTGINSYRAEQPLGGSLPPSSSDNKDKPQEITDPADASGTSTVRAAGAQLLAMAMIGADGLGTPGFKDVNNNGFWWDNTNSNKDTGAYYVDPTTGKEKYPRYGPYVDEKMRERAKTLKDLAGKGRILNSPPDISVPMFMDSWDTPILYYKASPASNLMIARMQVSPPQPGIYRQEDNGIITGTTDGQTNTDGLDFGAGKENGVYHFIASAKSPDATLLVKDFLEKPEWDKTFARFIVDPKSMGRPTPAQKDSYLLISAGPDSRYGTADDITNWTRETN